MEGLLSTGLTRLVFKRSAFVNFKLIPLNIGLKLLEGPQKTLGSKTVAV